jgi:hypothetical protein
VRFEVLGALRGVGRSPADTMRAIAVFAFLSLVACGDSTGPENRWLHDEYLMVSLGPEDVPASINSSLTLVSGELLCPPAESGQPAQEEYLFVYESSSTQGQLNVRFEPVCELEGTNRIRYTYPETGESIVGTVWKGEQGQVLQTKPLPSREAYLWALGSKLLVSMSVGSRNLSTIVRHSSEVIREQSPVLKGWQLED